MSTHKQGKKQRKFNRNRAWCESYRRRGQREKNKNVKLNRHLLNHPNDKSAIIALKAL